METFELSGVRLLCSCKNQTLLVDTGHFHLSPLPSSPTTTAAWVNWWQQNGAVSPDFSFSSGFSQAWPPPLSGRTEVRAASEIVIVITHFVQNKAPGKPSRRGALRRVTLPPSTSMDCTPPAVACAGAFLADGWTVIECMHLKGWRSAARGVYVLILSARCEKSWRRLLLWALLSEFCRGDGASH